LADDLVYQDKFDIKTGKRRPTIRERQRSRPKRVRVIWVFPNRRFVYLVNELDASIYVLPWDAKTVP